MQDRTREKSYKGPWLYLRPFLVLIAAFFCVFFAPVSVHAQGADAFDYHYDNESNYAVIIQDIDAYYNSLDDTVVIAYLVDGAYTQKSAFLYMYRLEYSDDYESDRSKLSYSVDYGDYLYRARDTAKKVAVVSRMVNNEFKAYANSSDGKFSLSASAMQGATSEESIFGEAWNQLDVSLYGSSGQKNDAAFTEEEKVGKWEKKISSLLGETGWKLYKIMHSWRIDVTVDGLVYGRMAQSYSGVADFTHFGLEENNPYGTVAAAAYYVLRRAILAMMPVVILIMLMLQLFKNTNKGRAQLKEVLSCMVLIIILLFAMPYLINFLIYFRDALLKVTQMGTVWIYSTIGLNYQSMGSSVVMIFRKMYVDSPSFLNGFLLLASVGSGLFYLTDYLRMAVLLTMCFAIIPIVLLFSVWNKRILTDYFNILLPNLLTQLVDLLLLQIPAVVNLMYMRITGDMSGSVVLALILLLIIWSCIPIRYKVLRLFGFDGFARSSGLGALAMMAMRMGRTVSGRRDTDRIGGAKDTPNMDNASMENARQRIMDKAWREPSAVTDDPGIVNYNPNLSSEVDDYVSKIQGEGAEPIVSQEMDASEQMPYGVSQEMDGGLSDELPTEDMEADGFSERALEDVDTYTAPGENVSQEMPEGTFDASLAEDAGMDGAYRSMISDYTQEQGKDSVSQMVDDTAVGEQVVPSQEDPFVRTNPIKDYTERYSPELGVEPKMDAEFKESLSPMDQQRYQNLSMMDAYRSKIAFNEREIKASGYRPETYQQDRADLISMRDRLDKAQAVSKQRMDAVNPVSDPEAYREAKRVYDEGNVRYEQVRGRINQLDRAHNLNRDNQTLRQRYQNTVVREDEAARVRALGGMDAKRYETANDYRYQTELNQIRKERANYKNFDTKQYEGLLTPKERSDFYREREERERNRRYADMAARTVSVGAQTAAAVTMGAMAAYGGPQAMGAAGMAGSAVAQGAADLASRGVGYVSKNMVEELQRQARKNAYEQNNRKNRETDKKPEGRKEDRGTSTRPTNQPTGKETVSDPIQELLHYK